MIGVSRLILRLEQRQSFTICKDILWQSETESDAEVNQKELELIRLQRLTIRQLIIIAGQIQVVTLLFREII